MGLRPTKCHEKRLESRLHPIKWTRVGEGRGGIGYVETVALSDPERTFGRTSAQSRCRLRNRRQRETVLNIFPGALSFSGPERTTMETSYKVAGIDVHKKMLAVVITDAAEVGEFRFERRKFGTVAGDLRHGDRPFVQQDGAAHDARVACEAAQPDAVGENGGAWRAGQVLGAVENPAQRGHSAKDLEELPGDMQGLELNGRISTAESLVEPPLVIERSSREHLVVAPRHVLGDRSEEHTSELQSLR